MSRHTKGKEQAPVTLKTSVEKKITKPRGRRGENMADRAQNEGKLNAPMNHMIDVDSYWACACQRPLTSGTKAPLVVNSVELHLYCISITMHYKLVFADFHHKSRELTMEILTLRKLLLDDAEADSEYCSFLERSSNRNSS